jgi:hypothetical protein
VEFFYNNQFKHLAAIPFALGFVFVAIFYLKSYGQIQNNGKSL